MSAFDPKRTFAVMATVCVRLVTMLAVAILSASCAVDKAFDLRLKYENRICEDEYPLQTTGYLVSAAVAEKFRLFRDPDVLSTVNELVQNKYSFFEVEKSTGRYVRFYLAPVGSEACARFDSQVPMGGGRTLAGARQLGLPVDLCVASESTDRASSRYLIDVDWRRDRSPPNSAGGGYGSQYRLFIQDRISSKTVAEWVYTDAARGGARAADYVCPRSKDLDGWRRATLRGVPDPRLGTFNKRIIQHPPEFPLSLDLQAFLVEVRPADRLASSRELAEQDSVIDNGLIELGSHRLTVVNPGESVTTEVRAFGHAWDGFQHLRVEGEEIYFLAKGMRIRRNKEVAVFRYSRRALPIAAYRIALPDLSLRENEALLVVRLSISDSAIEMTLVDLTAVMGGTKVSREWRLSAPISRNP